MTDPDKQVVRTGYICSMLLKIPLSLFFALSTYRIHTYIQNKFVLIFITGRPMQAVAHIFIHHHCLPDAGSAGEGKGSWSLSQLSVAERWGTSWAGWKFLTGLTCRDKAKHSHQTYSRLIKINLMMSKSSNILTIRCRLL